MAYVTYTVKQGDTLSEIALKFGTTVSELARINQIPNPEYIVVGQVLVISGDPISTTNNSNRAILQAFGLQSNTDRTVYAKWNWSKENTENYKVRWWYSTGDATGFIGSDTTTEFTHATYTAPENAVYVTFFVKPISKKHTVNDKEVEYWTAEWSTAERYFFKDNPPSVPDVPKVEIKDLTLTASLDNLDVNGTSIQFQIYRDHTTLYKTGSSTITNGHASFSCKLLLVANTKFVVELLEVIYPVQALVSSIKISIQNLIKLPVTTSYMAIGQSIQIALELLLKLYQT